MSTRLALLVFAILTAPTVAGDVPPNIVLIVADDLGWRDPGFMGSDYHVTPALDALAADGVTFSDAYANAANCAPSRAALLSGQYAPRTGVYTVGSPDRGKAKRRRLLTVPNRTRLDGQVVTLAELLRSAGYATAHVGKWHLGDGPEGPEQQGFDVNVAGGRRGSPRSYRSPYENPALPDGPDGEHLTARLTDEAIRFVDTHRDRPFFLYLPYYAVHTPIQPEPERLEGTRRRPRGFRHHHPAYAALVEGLDAGVGRLMRAIDERGLRERTIVVFTSDNGGHGPVTTMTPLRGSKGMFYEGGIRVPLVVRWPGVVEPGSRRDDPAVLLDLYPTLAAAGGAALPADQPVDGVDLRGLLADTDPLPTRSLYWHFPAYLEGSERQGWWRTTPCGAIRRGRYKLLEFFEDGHLELYDLLADPGETLNLRSARSDLAADLHDELRRWREGIGAPVPTEANPEFGSARAAPSARPPRPGGRRRR